MSMIVPPTAVVFTDPAVAVGALNEAHKLGMRVPHDISILGFDDADVRNQVYPNMSAVCQDARRLGYEAFQILTRMVSSATPRNAVREEFSHLVGNQWHDGKTDGTSGTHPAGRDTSYRRLTARSLLFRRFSEHGRAVA